MTFERNDGQVAGQFSFVSRHEGVEALFSLEGPDFLIPQGKQSAVRLGMRFLSAKDGHAVQGELPLAGRANYLRGQQRDKWITAVPTFAQLRYTNLYPGIDLLFHADVSGSDLEHDFIIAPGADPQSIQFQMRGADALRLLPDGQLAIEVQGKTVLFHAPLAYQETSVGRVPVAARFHLTAQRVVNFQLGKYDRNTALTIDPVLTFATYLDGSNSEALRALVSDASGNIYAVGSTLSSDFPTSHAEQSAYLGERDAFIAKLDPAGHSLIYSTYLGGSNTDEAESVAIDANGDVVVSGTSLSLDFPQAGPLTSTLAGYSETFVASLNASGSTLRYAGFLAANDPVQQATYTQLARVAVDTQGNAYVAGLTDDPTFTLTPGAYGGPVAPYPASGTIFLEKIQTDGTPVYRATIPQTPPQQDGSNIPPLAIGNIAVDSTGAVVLGGSAGNAVPTTAGALSPAFPNNPIDGSAGFALKLNAAGSALLFSTYLPGTDMVTDVALDAAGDVYLAGITQESNLPTTTTALQKTLVPRGANSLNYNAGFILKLSSDGTTALNATYIEGATPQATGGTDIGALVLDSSGNVIVAGATEAADLPLKNPLLSVIHLENATDLYLAQLTADLATLPFATIVDAGVASAQLAALAAGPSGHVVLSGSTFSAVFPTTAGSFQPSPPSPPSSSANFPRLFIAGIDPSVAAPSLCFGAPVNFGAVLVNTVANATANVTNCGNAPLTLTSVTSSDSTVTVTQNCSAIPPAASCQLQLAYAPTASGLLFGSLTLNANSAISPQLVSFSGTAGYPQVDIQPSLAFDDLLVGQTGSVNELYILNQGGGAFILTSAAVTGDFQITQNSCNNPVPVSGNCAILLNFSPTAAGPRTGVLTLTDNLNPGVQTVQLTGNGLTAFPVPTIRQVLAIPVGVSGTGALQVYGGDFFPNSTVQWNGQSRTTRYETEGALVADLLPADLKQVGEAMVTVTTTAPGGGTSAPSIATIYGRLQQIQVLGEVFEPHSQLIYATVAKTSQTYANSVVAIDPVAMKVVKTLLTGNAPTAIAVSDDGSLLYVGLDDLLSVTQIALPSGTQNFTVPLPSVTLFPGDPISNLVASALTVVPAQPHTWLAGLCMTEAVPCGLGVAIFDDATVRPAEENDSVLTVNSFVFVNDPTVVYSTEFNQLPSDISVYKISSTGIKRTAISAFLPAVGGSLLASDGSFIYDQTGQVIDPATLLTQFTYPQATNAYGQSGAFQLDTANHRLYFAGPNDYNYGSMFAGGLVLTAVGQTSQSTIGQIGFEEDSTAGTMERFGTNGLAIHEEDQWLFLKTSLTASTPPALSLTASPATLSFGSQPQGSTSAAQEITLTNTGTSALSISAITTAGDYSQTNNCGTSLAVSASCILQVSFTPAATGDRPGQVNIADNAPNTPQIISLDGTGATAAPVLSATVSPASLSFGSQAQGTTSAAQKIMVTNTGTAALSISAISVTGDYSQTNTCGMSLAVAASCAISVSFTPTTTGDRPGQLSITDNAMGASQSVSLDGTGATPAPPLTLAPQNPGGTTATVTAGNTATFNLTLSTATYSGVVGLSCAGAPAFAVCSITPAAPTVTAGAATSFAVTVTTGSSTADVSRSFSGTGAATSRVVVAGFGLLTLLSLPILSSIARQRRRWAGWVLLVFAIGFLITGCGGSSSSAPPSQPDKVAAGTYQLTLTAAAAGQKTTEVLTLIVQ